MRDDDGERLNDGFRNLFLACGGCVPGDQVLIVQEDAGDGYYDPGLAAAAADAARDIGLLVQIAPVPFRPAVTDPDPDLAARMHAADCTVFFARLGDQIRFRAQDASQRQVISYALDRGMMGSAFGTVAYPLFEALKALLNGAVEQADEVHVTCPEGTDFRGRLPGGLTPDGDVTRKRFPLSVFTPVPAAGFSGRIAQRGFLTGTGSNYYTPYSCELHDTLFVKFRDNRITGFDGAPRDVEAARGHYAFVGKRFGIEADFVHSWHAGIHPGCHYAAPAGQSFERWSGGAFGNPRLLHFHTCGAYPPGEISLNVLDPTVRLDGVAVWEEGRLFPDRVDGGTALLDSDPAMRALFDNPSPAAGQGPDGRLSFA